VKYFFHAICYGEFHGFSQDFEAFRSFYLYETVMAGLQIPGGMSLPSGYPLVYYLPVPRGSIFPPLNPQYCAFQHFLCVPQQLVRNHAVGIIGWLILQFN